MMEILVDCPATHQREEIGCLSDRDGEVLIVLRCSRFDPPTAVTCDMRCGDRVGCPQALARRGDHGGELILARWGAAGAA